MSTENTSLQALKDEYARLVALDERHRKGSYEKRLEALATRIQDLDSRLKVNPAFDRCLHDALRLPFDDLCTLIGRLIAERDGVLKGELPPSVHGRSYAREMAARIGERSRTKRTTEDD